MKSTARPATRDSRRTSGSPRPCSTLSSTVSCFWLTQRRPGAGSGSVAITDADVLWALRKHRGLQVTWRTISGHATYFRNRQEEAAVRKLFWNIGVPTVILLAFGSLSAQSAKTSSDQNVSGAWTLSAEGYVLPMTLNQD